MDDIVAFTLTGFMIGITMKLLKKRTSSENPNCVCVLDSFSSVKGYIIIQPLQNKQTKFVCHLNNLSPGKHGFHIHAKGDLRNECTSTCSHYNPTNASHGGAKGGHRHKGDLGNVESDQNGNCQDIIVADVETFEIVGRAIVIHADEDDLGLGDNEESKKTGNAGKRIGCGIIGRI